MKEARTITAIKAFMELIQTSVDLQNYEKKLLSIFEMSIPFWHQNVIQKPK